MQSELPTCFTEFNVEKSLRAIFILDKSLTAEVQVIQIINLLRWYGDLNVRNNILIENNYLLFVWHLWQLTRWTLRFTATLCNELPCVHVRNTKHTHTHMHSPVKIFVIPIHLLNYPETIMLYLYLIKSYNNICIVYRLYTYVTHVYIEYTTYLCTEIKTHMCIIIIICNI